MIQYFLLNVCSKNYHLFIISSAGEQKWIRNLVKAKGLRGTTKETTAYPLARKMKSISTMGNTISGR